VGHPSGEPPNQLDLLGRIELTFQPTLAFFSLTALRYVTRHTLIANNLPLRTEKRDDPIGQPAELPSGMVAQSIVPCDWRLGVDAPEGTLDDRRPIFFVNGFEPQRRVAKEFIRRPAADLLALRADVDASLSEGISLMEHYAVEHL